MEQIRSDRLDGTAGRVPAAIRLAAFAAGAAAFVGARAWAQETGLVSAWIWQFLLSCLAFAAASTVVRLLLTRLRQRGSTARTASGSRSEAEAHRAEGGSPSSLG